MSFIFLIILLYVMLIFIEISIITLKITGMTREKASFQVISLLTSTGFTTKESELITQHPVRRKVAKRIMMFKYFCSIIGTATLFNVYVNALATKITLEQVLIWVLMLSLVIAILRNKWIIKKIDFFVEKQIIRQSDHNKRKYKAHDMLKATDFGIVDIVLDEGSYLVGKSLRDSQLKQQYIQILQIDKGDSQHPFPKPEYIFELGDKLIVYGKFTSIKKLITENMQNAKGLDTVDRATII